MDFLQALEHTSFSPAETAKMSHVSPENLRVWRNRGLLDKIGSSDTSGRWKYSILEVFALWASKYLYGSMRQGHILDGLICAHTTALVLVEDHIFPGQTKANRIIAFYEGATGTEDFQGVGLSDLESLDFAKAEVWNLNNIAQNMPSEIKDIIVQTCKSAIEVTDQ